MSTETLINYGTLFTYKSNRIGDDTEFPRIADGLRRQILIESEVDSDGICGEEVGRNIGDKCLRTGRGKLAGFQNPAVYGSGERDFSEALCHHLRNDEREGQRSPVLRGGNGVASRTANLPEVQRQAPASVA